MRVSIHHRIGRDAPNRRQRILGEIARFLAVADYVDYNSRESQFGLAA
jgi:hypothetical protein